MKGTRSSSQEVDKICDANGQVIGDEEGVMERLNKEYFSGLLHARQQEEEGTKNDVVEAHCYVVDIG